MTRPFSSPGLTVEYFGFKLEMKLNETEVEIHLDHLVSRYAVVHHHQVLEIAYQEANLSYKAKLRLIRFIKRRTLSAKPFGRKCC